CSRYPRVCEGRIRFDVAIPNANADDLHGHRRVTVSVLGVPARIGLTVVLVACALACHQLGSESVRRCTVVFGTVLLCASRVPAMVRGELVAPGRRRWVAVLAFFGCILMGLRRGGNLYEAVSVGALLAIGPGLALLVASTPALRARLHALLPH